MPSTEQRLAALEAENARLRAEVAALKPTPRPSAPPEADGAVILAERPGSRVAMPTDAELLKLHAIVLAAYPVLREQPGPFEGSDAPHRRFVNAFRAVGMIGRTDAPNDKVALSYMVDRCTGLLQDARADAAVTGRAFVAAVLAHGDVPFRPLDRYPYDLAFGLAPHINVGRPAGDAWRRVLASGQAPLPGLPALTLKSLAAGTVPSW